MSESQENKTFKEDGIRPIENSEVEIADTFEEDGTRPIAESPDFLLTGDLDEQSDRENQAQKSFSEEQKSEDTNKNSSNPNSTKVVDTYEEDGTRPIMSNKYEVVDTIDIDGNRPITDK